jgi:hypothetical protein
MVSIKTTLNINKALYKAAKRVALEQETTVSEMVRNGLLLYLSDPEGVQETIAVLKDKKAMEAIQAGEQARQKGDKKFYFDWSEVRDL